MSEQSAEHVVIVGPDGAAVAMEVQDDQDLTELVEQPAKVMRIGSMIRQLLEEVKAAPLDEPGRSRLAGILDTAIKELKDGLAPELDEELDRLIEPFETGTPTESELRIAQAQLVGWLEGLFHGIQSAIYAQQIAARAQLEQMRRALPAGMGHAQHAAPQEGQQSDQPQRPDSGGMYL
jgi:hypothetical protein